MKGSRKEGNCSCSQCKHPFLHFSEVNNYMYFLSVPMYERFREFSYYLNHVQVPVGVSSPINTGSSQVQCWCCLIYSFFDTSVNALAVPWYMFYLTPFQRFQAQISAQSLILRELFKFQG